jgi:ABC-type bacteriocin/lantibiotic exporter with double-glycine peptidase domain
MKPIRLLNFPEFRQVYDYDCGANALQAILAYFGFDEAEGDIMDLLGTDKEWGTDPPEIIRVAQLYKIKTRAGRFTIDKLKQAIDLGFPVLITLQAWFEDLTKDDWAEEYNGGHYVICIGFTDDKIIFEDPSSICRTYLTYNELDRRWHDIDRYKNKLEYWGCIFYGLEPQYPLNKVIHMD